MMVEELRKTVRKLESEIDVKLLSYSRFGRSYEAAWLLRDDPVGTPVEDNPLNSENISFSMAMEIERLLATLQETNDELGRVISRQDSTTDTPNNSLLHVQKQHKRKLVDYMQEFNSIKRAIENAREQAELLSSVRADIRADITSPRVDTLLRERASLHASERGTDSILQQAEEAHQQLSQQQSILKGALGRVGFVANHFPGLNSLINNASRKKTRDSVIIALFIAAILCFFLWWWLSSS
mmetsp:Transcript_10187/g.25567  ORF Transcript_10187/g.25567 Transcript_10187/m.25567 type:complete len:240 (-) Transcript_10187:210-929(-)